MLPLLAIRADPALSLVPLSLSLQMDEIVTLNVGGVLHTTTRSTLSSRPSFLATMFSGRHALKPRADGSYFVDRDPTHFKRILNYLRAGAIAVPEGAEAQAELLAEAEFYALTDLVAELRAPPINVDLGAAISAERRRETELRLLSASGQGRQQPTHSGLISVFADDGEAATLVYSPDTSGFPTLLQYDAGTAAAASSGSASASAASSGGTGLRVAVTSLEIFRQNFSRRNPNILQRLEPILLSEPILIAGGAVLHALTDGKGIRTGGEGVWSRDELQSRKSDVDVFLHAQSPAEASRICHAIFLALAVDDELWVITRSAGVVNMIHMPDHRGGVEDPLTVQVVLRLYDSPAEVLLGFDIDCACCGFDGRHVWALPRCLRALRHGVNVLNPLHAWPNRATCMCHAWLRPHGSRVPLVRSRSAHPKSRSAHLFSSTFALAFSPRLTPPLPPSPSGCADEYRLVKYASRGFAIGVPGLDRSQVDFAALHTTPLASLKGLARLLKMTHVATANPVVIKSDGGGSLRWRRDADKPLARDPLALSTINLGDIITEDEMDIKCLGSGYEIDSDMIIPSVFFLPRGEAFPDDFASESPRTTITMELLTGKWPDGFKLALETREHAWRQIDDAGVSWDAPGHGPGQRVARKLVDAWDVSKRSREYLNASEGDIDTRYYVHAHQLASAGHLA